VILLSFLIAILKHILGLLLGISALCNKEVLQIKFYYNISVNLKRYIIKYANGLVL